MLEVPNGQILGHMDDGEENLVEAPEDEPGEDEAQAQTRIP